MALLDSFLGGRLGIHLVIYLDQSLEVKEEEREVQRRHLERAFRAVDKSAIQPESQLFKRVARDEAERLWASLYVQG